MNFSALGRTIFEDRCALPGETPAQLAERVATAVAKNDIKVIVLVTPHHSRFLEIIPDKEKTDFNSFLTYIKNKYDIKIINLQEKYSELSILNFYKSDKQESTFPDPHKFYQQWLNNLFFGK